MSKKIKRYVQRTWWKQSIAFEIIDNIRKEVPDYMNRTFIDLFWWWWSMSWASSYFFKNFIYNEIDKNVHDLFIAVQDNNLIDNLISKWVSREEFNSIKNKENLTSEENLILTIRSFGNNRSAYMYWKKIERRRYITHRIVFSETEDEYKELIWIYNSEKLWYFEKYWAIRTCYLEGDDYEIFIKQKNRRTYKFWTNAKYKREFIKEFDIELLKKERWWFESKSDVELIKHIEKQAWQLERLQSLQNLERLQSLERLEIDKTFNLSYDEVILPDSDKCILYLDPPYRWTRSYEIPFDFDKFDNRVLEKEKQWYIIFISEYNFPYWKVIWSKNKRWFTSQSKDSFTWLEKLYILWKN